MMTKHCGQRLHVMLLVRIMLVKSLKAWPLVVVVVVVSVGDVEPVESEIFGDMWFMAILWIYGNILSDY